MTKLACALAGRAHTGDGLLVERSDVQHQATANGSDVNHVFGLVGHDGAAAARKKRVGAVVHRDVIGNAVHQGSAGTDVFQCSGKLICVHE